LKSSIEIAGIRFKTKLAAEAHIRAILSRYGQMQPLAGEDLRFMVAVLDMHPNRETIVDCGVTRIVVQHLKDRYDSRRFVAVRTDSSIRDFTWRTALTPKTARCRLMRGCRAAVREQIRQFREAAFSAAQTITCPVSGEAITSASSDVDHIPPRTFEALVDAWLRHTRLSAVDIAFVPVIGYEQPDRWEDRFLEENWQSYHRIHADLRVIQSFANRSTVRKAAKLV
jgi:hypothetical protein